MYEWVVDSISTLFVPLAGQQCGSWPGSGELSSAVGVNGSSRPQEGQGRPAKRSYNSVHTPEGKAEHQEVKRQRRDVVVKFVKKTVSGVAEFLHLRNRYQANPQKPPANQIYSEGLVGVDEIPSHRLNTWARYKERKMEKQKESIFASNFSSVLRKQSGLGICSDITKGRESRRSFQLLPSCMNSSSDLELSSLAVTSRTHKPCLAVEEALKERDRERYRLLVEMVSEKYTKKKPLPFAQIKAPILPLKQDAHKANVIGRTCHNSTTRPGPVKACNNISLWRGSSSTGPLKARCDCGINCSQPALKENFTLQDSTAIQRNEVFSTASLNSIAGVKEQESKKQLVDVDLSADVVARLSLVDGDDSPNSQQADIIQQSSIRHEEFPRLSKEMLQEISCALAQRDPNLVLSSAFKLRITQRDLATLRDGSWLNDEVINFYMNLLMSRSQQKVGRKVYAFSTFFFPKLHTGGYSAVRRWTKAVDLFQYDVLLVPLHLGVHWSLAVIDLSAKTIKNYDSMGQRHDDICSLLLLYLEQEYKAKKSSDLKVNTWAVASMKSKEIPQQNNGSDCGVFTCKYADYLSLGRTFSFTQSHMPYFRRKMIWEILNKQLL